MEDPSVTVYTKPLKKRIKVLEGWNTAQEKKIEDLEARLNNLVANYETYQHKLYEDV